MQTANFILKNDLDYILEHTQKEWEALREQRILITGGTGFFGCWLLESLVWANLQLDLNLTAVVLTRNSAAFASKCPHLVKQSALHFIEGDVRDFTFPAGHFSHVIHAATDVNNQLNEENPLLISDTLVQGTKRTLEFAKYSGAKQFLLVSSGAVYGKQPADITHLPEDYPCSPSWDNPLSVYATGKCVAEHLGHLYAKQYGINVKIARGFAFVGPYLPLNTHLAIGNFIRDGLNGGPIIVNGDGTAYRSYLYAADLALWLWMILFRGQTTRPYNVGSADDLSIADLAQQVANCFQPDTYPVLFTKKPMPDQIPLRYVPSIERAQSELNLPKPLSLSEGIRRTIKWHKQSF